MGYEVKYAGVNLHDYFKVLNIKRTLLPPRTNFTKEIPSVSGQIYTGYKYDPKQIVLDCAFSAESREDFVDRIKQIAFVLDTKEPSKLILGDNPHCYNYAVIDGEIDIERVRHTGRFELKFICHDPFAYSIEDEVFFGNAKKVVTVDNGGTTEAYPKTSIEFSKDAFFLQCTNHLGETVLVGTPPSVEKTQATFDPQILRDNCETLAGWNSVGNIIDSGREVNGGLAINGGGYAITYGAISGGSNNKWYGGAMRKNLSTNLKDFRVEVKFEHNSQGDIKGIGAGTQPPVTTPPATSPPDTLVWVEYKVTAEPSLRVRSGRGTNYSHIGNYNKGAIVKVADIKNGWGYVGKHSGQDGYCSMEYMTKYTPPSSTPSTTTSTYRITPRDGLNVRSGRGTNYKVLTAIPYNTQVKISDISSGWGKVTYNGKTGYCSMQYTALVSSGKSLLRDGLSPFADDDISAENKLGIVEVYGFDQNGTKLFKFKMSDDQKWYEYSEPSVEFGSKLVLDDNKKCPSPKTVEVSTDGDKTVKQDTHSGTYGDWNNTSGWFTLERKTENNKQIWYAKVEKLGSDGKVVRTLQTQKLQGSYPTGNLHNIVIFIGQYNQEPIVDIMSVNEVYVTDLGNPPKPEEIKPIFRKGDELLIDSAKQKIYKNGKLLMNELDIGSQFFSVPVGNSQFICKSDDANIDVIASIQKKWL